MPRDTVGRGASSVATTSTCLTVQPSPDRWSTAARSVSSLACQCSISSVWLWRAERERVQQRVTASQWSHGDCQGSTQQVQVAVMLLLPPKLLCV